MRNKILVLEDNLYTAQDLLEEINFSLSSRNKQNIDVIVSNSIDEANTQLEQIGSGELICLVADLNMNPDGLSEIEQQETQGAVLTGWIWTFRHILNDVRFEQTKIVFYSAFISRLEKNGQYCQLNSNMKKRLILIDKNEYEMNDLGEKVAKLV